MEKPQPAWRGYLREYAIIVPGVSLALAAQLGIRRLALAQARIAACNQASARKF